MKNIMNLVKILVAATVLLVIGCTKELLEKPVQGALNESILTSREGVNALLIGAYAALDGVSSGTDALAGGSGWSASPSNFLQGSIAGGEAHKGAGGGSEIPMIPYQRWNAMDPSNSYLNNKWRSCYEGVNRANSVIRILSKATDLSPEERSTIEAQARFLRSHFYFDLKKNWNMVPWVDENTTDYNVPNDQDIWPMIEADFTFAMNNLPESWTEIGRANKWAAASYLGKALVYQQKWPEAKLIFDQVITQGKNSKGINYDLTKAFQDNFDAATENNEESVFVVQMTPNLGTNDVSNSNGGDLLNYPVTIFSCCGIYIPSQDLVNSFRTNGQGLPYLDEYNRHPVKSDQGINSDQPFIPDTGPLDPRLDWTVGRRGVPYLDWGVHQGKAWIRDQAEAGPYSPVKNVHRQATQGQHGNYTSWAPGNAINLNLIRFADVLLLAAETEAQLGNLGIAEQYVNRLRQRAANPESVVYTYANDADPTGPRSTTPAANYQVSPYPAGTFAVQGKPFALKAIYHERKLELGLEGHRYYDISRWGIADQVLAAYYRYEADLTTDLVGAFFTKNKNEYYPIPQAQIDLTTSGGVSKLTQNPNY
ncbi:RagB/SusD family nutrient uptake outer membrane protein [Parapedobacter indicus]|uniref:Starch-binding associating with outer membrane n=1 Tax=Parapedobacter indicus TaxID=1477437 RepID=A0A1I3FGH3_9SPHI|nr:RagB/SusD family nutrient uptake outer membrane protein [Parapedobacter indicus]PPL03714.1 putative outer membrane starch-binding protein [Parapedobacter indicus]SFI10300.1 Starch-binding associating with outer membrane [Parapedobacter indicus]